MKTSSLLYSAFVGCAAAQSAYLYTIDHTPKHSSSTTSTIDSDTASSIIARRRGLDNARSLRTTDQSVLEEIEQHSGYQQPLFGDASSSVSTAKIFIRISGYDGGMDAWQF